MQISSNYSMNGVSYENRRRQNDIPQFSTERAKQENESINPYMADTDFNEKAFDMIGPNAPQDVKDAWMEAAKVVNANLRNHYLCNVFNEERAVKDNEKGRD